MIAKGRSISHGAAAGRYNIKKEGAVIVSLNHLSGDSLKDYMTQMAVVNCVKSDVKNKYLQFELSPSDEEAAKLETEDDWKALADKFAKQMKLDNNQYFVILHQDTKHKHLHFLFNRVNLDGKLYDDSMVSKRAQLAVELISHEKKWESADSVSEKNRKEILVAAKETLREMSKYSWEGYKSGMAERGYTITENRKRDGTISGYWILTPGRISKENFHGVKASKVSREITYSKLEQLWINEQLLLQLQEEREKERIKKESSENEKKYKEARICRDALLGAGWFVKYKHRDSGGGYRDETVKLKGRDSVFSEYTKEERGLLADTFLDMANERGNEGVCDFIKQLAASHHGQSFGGGIGTGTGGGRSDDDKKKKKRGMGR